MGAKLSRFRDGRASFASQCEAQSVSARLAKRIGHGDCGFLAQGPVAAGAGMPAASRAASSFFR